MIFFLFLKTHHSYIYRVNHQLTFSFLHLMLSFHQCLNNCYAATKCSVLVRFDISKLLTHIMSHASSNSMFSRGFISWKMLVSLYVKLRQFTKTKFKLDRLTSCNWYYCQKQKTIEQVGEWSTTKWFGSHNLIMFHRIKIFVPLTFTVWEDLTCIIRIIEYAYYDTRNIYWWS